MTRDHGYIGQIAEHPFRAIIASGTLVSALAVSGCSAFEPAKPTEAQKQQWAAQKAEDALPEVTKKCRDTNRRTLPTATNVTLVDDPREGSVFACEYFLDEGIAFNTPVKLFKSTDKEFVSESFKANGNVGGLAILGSGLISGSAKASGYVEMKQIVGLKFEDVDGAARTAIVSKDKFRILPCKDTKDCNTVTFALPDTELWDKGENHEKTKSIWLSDGFGYNGAYRGPVERVQTVSQIALPAPNDNPDDGQYRGGPAPLGQVISALVAPSGVTIKVSQAAYDAYVNQE